MDEKIEIDSSRDGKFSSLLFRDKILPEVLAQLKKDIDKKGELRISKKELEQKLESLYGQEYRDLSKIYSAFGGEPLELSPKDIASRFRRARIPLGEGKYTHVLDYGDDFVVNTNDFKHLPDPSTIDGRPQYDNFEPDTYYGTTFGPELSIGAYTDESARFGENPGLALNMKSIPSVIEGLNRSAKGRSYKEKPDAGMELISRYIPGNDKSYSKKLTVKTPHELHPSITTKKGQAPTIESVKYVPYGASFLHIDEQTWNGNSFISNTPEEYEDRVTKDSIENVRRFLHGNEKSHERVVPIRKLLADNLRFKGNIDLSQMPKTPEELHELEVKEVDKSSIPSPEELTKALEKIKESEKMYNHSVLHNAFNKGNTTNFSEELDELMIQTKFHDHNSTSRKVKDALWGFVPLGPAAVAGNNRRLAGLGTAIASYPLTIVPLIGPASRFYYGGYKAPRQLRADMQGLDNPKVRKKLKELYEKGIEEIEAKKLAKMLKVNPKKLFKENWTDSVKTAIKYTLDDVPEKK